MSSDAVKSQRAYVPVLVLSTIAPMGLMTSVALAQDDGPVQLGPITVMGVAESTGRGLCRQPHHYGHQDRHAI